MTNFVENLADTVRTRLGTSLNYGEPVKIADGEMVPVSLATFGFGGGSGDMAIEKIEASESGFGGGGGGVSIPVGAYVKAPNGPEFVPNLIALIAVSIPLTFVTGYALSAIIRALKK